MNKNTSLQGRRAEDSWAPGRSSSCLQKSLPAGLLPALAGVAQSPRHAELPTMKGRKVAGLEQGVALGRETAAAQQGRDAARQPGAEGPPAQQLEALFA